ncbi:uncharacterized protein LOC130222679 [Danio aesculapii]|uniref:uncharacterized protein LOC130222679 n=1 Tax=Danio aesculapii TaxID=1142201 RepID=UPI0024BF4245|nr:uncharacterized protein LOC130222679 [Danio aesculapii]
MAAQSRSKAFCCVPKCSNSKQKQPYLSFHEFPTNDHQRQKWVHAIRRDEGPTFAIRRASTLVCSQHFTAADFMQGSCRLKAGVIQSRFQWNNFHVPPQKQSAFESNKDSEVIVKDHDYAAHPPPGALDEALEYIAELEARLKKISLETPTVFSRFCVSDHTIRYYTRFPSQEVFQVFWESVCPSATNLMYWTKAQRMEIFSNYKSTTTFKRLLGVAPCGAVTFISRLYTGSISDKEITRRSGILSLLEPGDEVMSDKGFTIDMITNVGATLIIPPFKCDRQFSKTDCQKTQTIAWLRILVERLDATL